ncbi:MAG: hypothetical protein WCX22_12540 [Methanoregula sp.]
MTLEKKDVIKTIEKTISRYAEWRNDPTSSGAWGIHTLLVETIWQCAPDNSSFRRNAKYIIDRPLTQYSPAAFLSFSDEKKLFEDIEALLSVLSALKNAYEDNLLINVQQRIHADIFEDFIEIADKFLQESEKLKCPAAVMLGSVLETHIRKLCENNGIKTTIIKGENEKFRHLHDMNAELVKKGVYNTLQHGQIDVWYKIRSEAAHGNDTAYSKQQVVEMLSGIRRFIGEYPA